MDEKNKNRYESIPIPSYEEATSSRPTSPQSPLGPEEISDDAERQGLLHYADRNDPRTRNRYEPPAVESVRSSVDLLPLEGGSERLSAEVLRREIEQMEVEEPDNDNASHRSLLTSRFSKSIVSFTSSFSSIHLPFRQYLPSWKWFSTPFHNSDTNNIVIFGRLFGAFLLVGVVYMLIASDIISLGGKRNMGQIYDPGSVRQFVQNHMNVDGNIQRYLEYITKYPHMAGTEGDFILGEWIQELFKVAGLSEVEMERFDVYVNYPKTDGRRVAIIDPPEKRWEAIIEEQLAYQMPYRENTLVFHGLSKSGNVTGHLVYANYGSEDDFKYLEDNGISLKGAIALVRYYGTQSDRALKVKLAELAGAAGCIIYSDPANDGFLHGEPWPEGRFMPKDGVQRGSVALTSWTIGDVLSPGWASTPLEKKRISPEESTGLNQIPSIPIAWRDAQRLVQSLESHGRKVPEEWKGGIPEVEFWTGDESSPVINLMNLQDEETYQPIYNILGTIPGWEQPDKKVIVGNHRDAWCFGGVDPGSGTAIMLEVVRVFGELLEHGWRPLRTIEFASWDAEEYNLIGSTEHVENREEELRRNGYAYINVDVGVQGDDFHASASPLFERSLLRVLGRTSDPILNRTLQEIWNDKRRGLEGLGAGSDHVAFQDIVGTSSLDMSFKGLPFPYHSCYDNFEWMKKFGDPDFAYHKVMGEVWALLILEMADRPVLPFDMEAYASAVTRYVADLETHAQPAGVLHTLDLSPLSDAARTLEEEARNFHEWDRSWTETVYGSGGFESNVMAIHRMSHNNRMANFETHLLDLEDGGGVC